MDDEATSRGTDPLDPENVDDDGAPGMETPTTDELGALLPGVDRSVLSALPGLARIAIGTWARTAGWGASSAYHAGQRLTEAAHSGESAAQFIDEMRDELARNARRALGLDEGAAAAPSGAAPREGPGGTDTQRRDSLRARGAALLNRSADVDTASTDVHPGFDRIVDQLSPDEARVLRLLRDEGPRGIVYVNRAGPLGFGAREVARRLSLIGREAGCVHPELVPAYLDNLVRLGLVAIRRDPVGDESLYQVIEAQPEVVDAMKRAHSNILLNGQTSRRGVHLTDFGHAFCEVCLSTDPDEA